MNCAVERHNRGTFKMKTLNYVKNSFQKEQELDKIVSELCTRLQQQQEPPGGMRLCSLSQAEAVRRYCAAFPALTRGAGLPQLGLPPPAWCRPDMPPPAAKKLPPAAARRTAYSRKAKKRLQPSLPEWVTHEAAWDMAAPDPVQDFLRTLAVDEGYGTAENTVTDDLRDATAKSKRLADFDDGLDLDADFTMEDLNPRVLTPMEEEMYAKFEAKFDRSIEALWAERDTPDDECQELPIDFHDLLSSPSDNMFMDPAAEKCISLEKTPPVETDLHTRLRPLRLDEPEPFSLYSYEGIYEALPSVADVMRSLTALNHSKKSSFTEVLPRPRVSSNPAAPPAPAPAAPAPADPHDDLLTSETTHFKPIRKEAAPRYKDGDTFDIRGDLDPVLYTRSASGSLWLEEEGVSRRYLEYRTRSPDYAALGLPALGPVAPRLKFPAVQQDVAVQTEPGSAAAAGWPRCGGCGGRGGKQPRSSIWAAHWECSACEAAGGGGGGAGGDAPSEPDQEWDELLADISAATGGAGAGAEGDRKRRRSRPRPHASCSHPHAPFLHCLGAHRPLTR